MGTMRDHEDLSTFEALILALLMEDDHSAEEVARDLDARMAPVVGTPPARRERGQ